MFSYAFLRTGCFTSAPHPRPGAADPCFPDPGFYTVFYVFSWCPFALPLPCQGAQSGAEDGPKCPKGAKKEPKSSLLRAKSVTFRCHIGESGPLLKHQQGLCFQHIMRVRAPPFLRLNSPRERTAHQECSFSHFWLHFWRPSGTQGRPKGAQRSQKEPQSLPRDT